MALLTAVVSVSAGLEACTPIEAVGNPRDQLGNMKADAAPNGDEPQNTLDLTKPCAPEGQISCVGSAGAERRICKQQSWEPYGACKEAERCQSAPGANQGACVPVLPECLGHATGVAFCDGEQLRVCSDMLSSVVLSCGQSERCRVVDGGRSICSCATGAIATASGCQLANDCSIAAGGCDPLTTCSVANGQRTCSGCPAGYQGDGLSGCVPQLGSLGMSCGTLTPPLAAGAYGYVLQATLLCPQIELQPTFPGKTRLAINGAALEDGETWRSGVLDLGETPLNLTLTAQSGLSATYKLSVQRQVSQDAYLKASTPGRGDSLGASIAIDGNTLVAGAPFEDSASNKDQSSDAASNSGAAYVFVRQGEQWTQPVYLKPDMPVAGEYFGVSVAVLGDLIAVGAPANDPLERSSSVTRSGAVYLFQRDAGVWKQLVRLAAADANGGNMFGFNLQLTNDLLVVGAPYESSQGARSGAVYLYARGVDGTWAATQKLKASEPVGDSAFGGGLAIDGDTLVAGAFSDGSAAPNAGSAYVFTRSQGTWTQQQRLQPSSPVNGANFGWSAAVRGDVIVVGAPRWGYFFPTESGEVYVYLRSGTRWSQTAILTPPIPRMSDFFGVSLVLTPSFLVVGMNGDWSGSPGVLADLNDGSQGASGAVFLYAAGAHGAFSRSGFIKATMPHKGDSLGLAIAISGDMLVTGAPHEDGGLSGVNPKGSAPQVDDSGALYVFR